MNKPICFGEFIHKMRCDSCKFLDKCMEKTYGENIKTNK